MERHRTRLVIWLSVAVVAIDQAAKLVVRDHFALHESLTVVPGFFDLTRVHNYGAAFGMLNSAALPYQSALLTAVRVAALAGLAWYATTVPDAHRLARLGLSLVVGGAAGNLVDGFTLGYVVDFFDFYWHGWHFWAFNVADAAITVGMALVILDQLGVGRDRVPEAV